MSYDNVISTSAIKLYTANTEYNIPITQMGGKSQTAAYRHRQNAWARHVERVVSCRDVTRRATNDDDTAKMMTNSVQLTPSHISENVGNKSTDLIVFGTHHWPFAT